MSHAWHDTAFTKTVQALQEANGSRASYARFEDGPLQGDRIDAQAAAFIEARDSFYMASVGETGWPYIQHRGGPDGFMKVLDDRTLGFADFAGNKQYVSLGNLQTEDRVSLFFMDYPNRTRLKLFGRALVIDPEETETLTRLAPVNYRARIERGIRIKVEALDWNCPQHITPRYTEDHVAQLVKKLTARVADLEEQLAEAGIK